MWVGFELFIIVTNPKNLEKILKSQLSKGNLYDFARPFSGNGISVAAVEQWKIRRRHLNRAFNQNILNSYTEIFNKHSKKLIEHLNQNLPTDGKVDLFKELATESIGAICELCMGIKSDNLETNTYIHTAFQRLTRLTAAIYLNPLYHLGLGWKLSKSYREIMKVRKELATHFQEVVNNRRSAQKGEAYLDFLLSMHKEGQLTEEEIIDEMIVVLFAGVDSTTITMSFVMILLALHQDIQEKVYQEQLSLFKNSTAHVTINDLSNMPYLERVIKETQRLFTPIPVILRSIDEDIIIDNHVVPKDSKLLVSLSYMHRNPDYWPDPLKFDPDRFLPEKMEERPRHAFMPFSIPSRNCIGQRFAEHHLKITISTFLRNFRVVSTTHKSIEDIQLYTNISIEAVDGYQVTLEKIVN